MHEFPLATTKRRAFWAGLIILALTFCILLNFDSQKIIDTGTQNNRNGFRCTMVKDKPETQKRFPNQIGQVICPPDFPLFSTKKFEKAYSDMVIELIIMVFWASIGGNLIASSLREPKTVDNRAE